MDQEEFFAQLDALTPKEIEQRLTSWDKEQLLVVQEYLKNKHAKAQSDEIARAASDAAWAAAEAAMRANSKATIAIIIATVALLAVITFAVAGVLRLL
jgi:hypothetical protein